MTQVSIIMPCFNQAAFVVEALQSVLAQTCADWECIVVDDGSTDRSAAVVREFIQRDARFVLLGKTNGGVASARNLGIARSSGRYILPLDADDTIAPDFLQHAMACFASHPKTELVYPRTKLFGEKRKTFRLPSYSYERLLWRNMLVNSCVYTRSAFDQTSGYSEDMVHGYEDWELYVRMLKPGSEVRHVADSIYNYRIKKVSRATRQLSSGKVEESMGQIYRNNQEVYSTELSNPISVFDKRLREFSSLDRGKYKRQILYTHVAYLLILAVIAGLHFT